MKELFPIYFICLLFVACHSEEHDNVHHDPANQIQHQTETALTFSQKAEKEHRKDQFLLHDSLLFDIVLSFGGKERLNGELALATNSSGGRISYQDGRYIHYGTEGIRHSETINPNTARFAAYTWSYFALMPYKLNDPGTHWEQIALDYQDGKSSHKLTFGANIGDAPDDWYVVQTNEQGLLEEAAYIVTAGSTVEEAEADPHAIRYHNYELVEGIPFAKDWTFHSWSKLLGSTDTLGTASLSNFRFK